MPARPDVAAVLGRLGIEARRRGRELHARCPNREHEDKHPSWRIRDDEHDRRHALHNCFGCGFGGSLNDLVMHVRGLSWAEAEAWLEGAAADDARPTPAVVELRLRPPPSRSFELPEGVEVALLDRWPGSARAYAVERGITAEQVDRWGIGYAAEGRLRGRIVFVKRDAAVMVGGYSARTFVGGSRKYLEPEQWERPRSVMFGEEHWPPPDERGRLYVVEGAINALAIERALPGAHVGATVGSELTPMAALKLAGWRELVLVTDPDKAGDRLAADIGVKLGRHGVAVRRVRLPEGQDAATMGTDLTSFIS